MEQMQLSCNLDTEIESKSPSCQTESSFYNKFVWYCRTAVWDVHRAVGLSVGLII